MHVATKAAFVAMLLAGAAVRCGGRRGAEIADAVINAEAIAATNFA